LIFLLFRNSIQWRKKFLRNQTNIFRINQHGHCISEASSMGDEYSPEKSLADENIDEDKEIEKLTEDYSESKLLI